MSILISLTLIFLFALFTYFVFEYFWILKNKQNLNGPQLMFPPMLLSLKNVVTMVKEPYFFWKQQQDYGTLSWTYLAGFFTVFSTDADTCREIFKNDKNLRLALHPNATKILGANNIAFMNGESHKKLRKELLWLFTQRALAKYIDIQAGIIDSRITHWMNQPQKLKVRDIARELNLEVSQSVFLGPHLNQQERKIFGELYADINEGLLAFPIYFPGTKLWRGVRAREQVVNMLVDVVAKSREGIQRGDKPSCLTDFLVEKLNEDEVDMSNYEVACLVLDFLFASQDATTAALVWIVTLLGMPEHRETLRKIREEQEPLRGESYSLDRMHKMSYTRAVVKEILRYKPPATMVPHIAFKDTKVGNVNVPKNTLVIPDIWGSCVSDFENGDQFIPERFLTHEKSNLVFGYGPHACLGKEYALNNLCIFAATLATKCKWNVEYESLVNVEYGPTIYPRDSWATFHSYSPSIYILCQL